MIWFFLTLMLAIAAAFSAAPFMKQPRVLPESGRKELYQRQIAEIDAEQEQLLISPEEASALRLEAQRRLLQATSTSETKEPAMALSNTTTALVIAALVVIGGVSLYAIKGSPAISSAATVRSVETKEGGQPPGSLTDIIDQVTARLEQQPDDAEGWRVLGWSYFNLGRYAEAVDAYQRAVDLAPQNADYLSSYAEALIMTAGGAVTDDAIAVLDRVVAIAPSDPRARFFKGLALDQGGDPAAAIDVWIEMVKSAPVDAPWTGELRNRIAASAAQSGINIDGRLPAAPVSGPSRDQMNAAAQLSPAERQAMIEGMVARLAAKLAENPNDADGWIQLIRSQMVLGRSVEAKASLKSALDAFADAPEQRARISGIAAEVGLVVN
jgi:cytochrome c-type biogenesis protein CcmH